MHGFLKRMDPGLPFYYHTSTHTQFYEGVMPVFDTKPSKNPWQKRIPSVPSWIFEMNNIFDSVELNLQDVAIIHCFM